MPTSNPVENVVLGGSSPTPQPDPTKPPYPDNTNAEPKSADFPKVLYHKSSKPGNLIAKTVETAEDAAKLGGDWGDLKSLGFETAPAEGTPTE